VTGAAVSAALSIALFAAVGAALLSAPASQAAPARIPDTLAHRLQACSVCHGKDGQAAPDGYRPRIAGKPAGYLYHQLLNFRDGRRHYGPMVALVDALPEPYLREIAEHYATLYLPYAAPPALPPAARPPAELLARGRALALEGDKARNIPACRSCHGQVLTGSLPATPGLLGLPRDYLMGQLGAWHTGQRRALAPDCMAEIVQRLAPGDISAVSAWLSSQPVPADAHPQPPGRDAAPLRCGSVVDTGAGVQR
jgi:cytochrome c553